ncbi:short chain enoyl-CoA hydratase /enoyl-CoA hydratase [Amycolatopsis sulphurea]|uniref:Short chain enoyl-CoA hydratase /enoyl-CoA hydratase n=1 Tax=Amycolatopsis sulphurea TaxID=76022 RepID=A0A2A9FJX8_9PSEU|nr:enoyl-CoA hydratase-related protein [Amycolatopsis sulphurea]PFG50735.1 short chain enoyl-CoA hydratase /enoyl-CoA hydratase [Amycolatopsis sulphurea]
MPEVISLRTDAVLTITLDRPRSMNALTESCRRELLTALHGAADPAVRAVVLTGAGRAFCVGQDLSATDELVRADVTVRDTYNPLVRALKELDKPVIAAVNGPAVGAGTGLALACDLRLMAETAYFACSFSKVGLVPDTGLSHELVRSLGHARAYELAATGRTIGAAEAAQWGLVNRVVPLEALAKEAGDLAGQLSRGPGLALALTKRLFTAAAHAGGDTMLEREALSQGVAAATAEHTEGVAAFREKRAANHDRGPVTVPATVPLDAI